MAFRFQFGIQLIIQIVDSYQTFEQPGMIVDLLNLRFIIVISCVIDGTHNLFHQVFDGYDSGESAVFVYQYGNILMGVLKLLEQFVNIFAFQYKIWLMEQRTNIHMFKTAAPCLQNKIFHIQNTDNIINIFLVYRNSGMTCSQHLIQIGRERFVHIDGIDIRTGSHDFPCQNIVKLKYRVKHLRFIFVKQLHAIFDQGADLCFRYFLFRYLIMHSHQTKHQSGRYRKQFYERRCDF